MTRPIRVLELRSVRGTGGGPEKTILLGTARTDPRRFAITVCYLRDQRDSVFSIDAKAAGLPIDYVELTEAHSFDVSIFSRLRRLVREREIDIVHAHDYKTDVLAWLLGKAERVTPMATAHGWTGHSRREHAVYYPLDKRVLARFPRVVAVSSDVRRELIGHGASADAVTTVLNGIDHTAFHRDRSREQAIRRQLGLAEDDIIVGAVGRAEPQKRFDLLLEAFAALKPGQPRLKLIIVGAGSCLAALQAQATRLGLGDSCRLLGNRTDIADLHHTFDVFVQSSDYEGTPERGAGGDGVREPGRRHQRRRHRGNRQGRHRRVDRADRRRRRNRRRGADRSARSVCGSRPRDVGAPAGRDGSLVRDANECGGGDLCRSLPAAIAR